MTLVAPLKVTLYQAGDLVEGVSCCIVKFFYLRNIVIIRPPSTTFSMRWMALSARLRAVMTPTLMVRL